MRRAGDDDRPEEQVEHRRREQGGRRQGEPDRDGAIRLHERDLAARVERQLVAEPSEEADRPAENPGKASRAAPQEAHEPRLRSVPVALERFLERLAGQADLRVVERVRDHPVQAPDCEDRRRDEIPDRWHEPREQQERRDADGDDQGLTDHAAGEQAPRHHTGPAGAEAHPPRAYSPMRCSAQRTTPRRGRFARGTGGAGGSRLISMDLRTEGKVGYYKRRAPQISRETTRRKVSWSMFPPEMQMPTALPASDSRRASSPASPAAPAPSARLCVVRRSRRIASAMSPSLTLTKPANPSRSAGKVCSYTQRVARPSANVFAV